jgi:hypothetical protein
VQDIIQGIGGLQENVRQLVKIHSLRWSELQYKDALATVMSNNWVIESFNDDIAILGGILSRAWDEEVWLYLVSCTSSPERLKQRY